MLANFYQKNIIEKPKFIFSILLFILIIAFYFSKDFRLDASSETLLLENDPDLIYLNEINEKYGAKELSVPVLALSQLSRAVEQRDDKKPLLSDLRESGSIEQDADVVMFVFRESYYLKNKEPRPATVEHAEWQAKMNEISHLAELLILKQRHGPTGTIMLEFEEMFTKFKDIQNN